MQTLEDIRRPVEKEFAQYEEAIAAAVASDNALVQAVMDHVFQKRGKQMRPFLVLLSAAICGQVNSKTIGTAVALELLLADPHALSHVELEDFAGGETLSESGNDGGEGDAAKSGHQFDDLT